MVMPDWTAPPRPPKIDFQPVEASAANSLFARPTERLAAVIVDLFVVLAPLFILLSAPMKKWLTLSFLVGTDSDLASTISSMLGLGTLLIVVYQTFMHHFFRATLGKLLFDLRVVPMFPGQYIGLWDQFVRSLLWISEIFMLGLPLLAIFSNAKRRPLHDRVCDTLVISTANTGVVSPAILERTLVRGTFALVMAFALLVVLSQVRGNIEALRSEAAIAALMSNDLGSCEVVSRNVTPETEDKKHGRLELAMTLYAAGLADRSCLEAEVEREIAGQIAVGSVTYLAQAFVHADDAEISNSYLDEVCESAPGSVECAMATVVGKWSQEDWPAVDEAINQAPRGNGYLEVWGVRHFMKQARYDRALELLNNLTSAKYLSEFSLVQRVKALYNSFREPEAEAALMQAMSALPEFESKDIGFWVCAQQLQNGCSALESSACQSVSEGGKRMAEIDFEQSHEALARVLALECRDNGTVDYLSFSEAVSNRDWQRFFTANLKRQRDDRKASFALFAEILDSEEAPDILRVEAARRVSQFANVKQIDQLFERWRDMKPKEAWVKTGNILFRRLAEMKQDRRAMKVARYLMSLEALSPQAFAVLSDMNEPGRTERTRQPAGEQ